MYLRVFEISASKYMKCSFSYYTRISMASSYKKEQKTLDLLTDIDVIIMHWDVNSLHGRAMS